MNSAALFGLHVGDRPVHYIHWASNLLFRGLVEHSTITEHLKPGPRGEQQEQQGLVALLDCKSP